MNNYELYLPIERPQRNPTNGQFLKGNVPHNKGRKWSDYLDDKTADRLRRMLRKMPRKGNVGLPGWNARPIVAYDDEGNFIGWFKCSCDAERKTGICARNIRLVLEGKRKHAGGYKWEYANK